MIVEIVGVVILGLVVGSFLNVCIYRLPRGMGIITPPSSCPHCASRIKPYDNIPLVSYIILGGKCRYCKGNISIRYPLVELSNAILYLLCYQTFGFGLYLPIIFAFVSSMIVITFIDLEFQIIPDVITLPGIIIGLISASLIFPDPFDKLHNTGFLNSIIGILGGGGFFLLVAIISRGGMGGGDIKMIAMVGAFLGYKGVLLTILFGSLIGSLVGIGLMIFKGKDRKTKVPFGPFLALGCLLTLFYGDKIMHLYLGY
ncbi:MAG: prepilin peptidase [Thermodesulfovibrionales bacterium]|nr:prepilin peptidase [Thermodesulfovibrionales bacterium]